MAQINGSSLGGYQQLTALGDKGRALRSQIDSIRRICDKENLQFEFFIKPKPRIFDGKAKQRSLSIFHSECQSLAEEAGLLRYRRHKREATSRKSYSLVREMMILALLSSGLVQENGRALSESAICSGLGIRRPEHRRFFSEREILNCLSNSDLNDELNKETQKKIISETYGRIRKQIAEL